MNEAIHYPPNRENYWEPNHREQVIERFGMIHFHTTNYMNRPEDYYYKGPRPDLEFRPLTEQEEIDLFKQVKDGSTEARDFLIKNHLIFAANYARKMVKRRLPDDEVVSAANYAIMRAIDRFEPGRGNRFISYLKPVIRGEIAELWKTRNIVDYKNNFPKSDDNTSEYEPMAFVEEPEENPRDDHAEHLAEMLRRAKIVLNGRELKVLELHYEQELSFADIGRKLGVCREAIRATHNRALNKLKTSLENSGVNTLKK